ncbi:MAG: carbohydrate porin [Longimicrobiales bacterium]
MSRIPETFLALLLVMAIPIGASAAQDGGQESSTDPADLALTYIVDLAANASGGVDRGVVGLGNLDAVVRLDGESLAGWEGAELLLYGLGNHGGKVTALTGDAQAANNIESPASFRLYEAWIQQNFPQADLSVLAGLYDVNSEFDVLREARVFLNSSFGIGAEFAASGRNGPSIFPVTSLGTRIQWHPTHRWYVQGAVLDGVPGDPADPGATAIHLSSDDGVLWVAELGHLAHARPEEEMGEPELGRNHVHRWLSWRVSLGAWGYSRSGQPIGGADTGGPGSATSHPGAYAMVELHRYRESEGDQVLGVFARAGIADDRTNRFGAYTGFGLNYRGLVPGRDEDVVGLGVATAYNGRTYEASLRERGIPVTEAETSVELTYRARVTRRIFLQPDLQLVIDPNTDPRIPDAWLFTTRLELRW